MKIIFALNVLAIYVSNVYSRTFDPTQYRVSFQDEFPGTKLRTNLWKVQTGHDTFGENRLMCFQDSDENIKVLNGVLIINATVKDVECVGKTIASKQFTSGRIRTRGTFNFSALEFEGRISKCEHCQPGFWWQKSSSKIGANIYEEVDVMEAKGTDVNRYYINAHWGRNYSHLTKMKVGKAIHADIDLSEDFHNYTVEKTDDLLVFYFDGEEKANITRSNATWRGFTADKLPDSKNKPFSEAGNVIISLLISGNWFKNDTPLTTDVAENWEKSTLEVKRVTIFE